MKWNKKNNFKENHKKRSTKNIIRDDRLPIKTHSSWPRKIKERHKKKYIRYFFNNFNHHLIGNDVMRGIQHKFDILKRFILLSFL